MNTNFSGFSPKTREFFIELEQNNNKDWFEANRSTYEKEIKNKSHQLVEVMSDSFAGLDLPYVSDKKKSLFRINRDIRFSKDKSPYKINLGIFFPFSLLHSRVQDPQSIGLYFHFDGKETFAAGGLHMPDSTSLHSIRSRIYEEWDLFEKLITDKNFKKEYPIFSMENSLKTTPKGFPAEHPSDKYLKLKEYTVYSMLDFDDCYSGKLIDILNTKAIAMAPFLEFLKIALENY